MASPHWVEQFLKNQAIIARASNARDPQFDMEIIVEDEPIVIADCGHVIPAKEVERNFGFCDRCAQYGEVK